LLAFANPISVIFWIGVFANTIAHTKTGFFLNLFILIGVLIWGIILSLFLQVGKEMLQTKKIQWIVNFSNIIMLAYGIYYTYKTVKYFIN
jgi:threonine/homoserine/homoserine lactone efflux protein